MVDLIHRSFLLPSCKVDLSRYHPRPCLQYYIKRCLGPCVEGLTTPPEYRQAVRDAQMFLEGRQTELSRSLEERMEAAAGSELFELAARYRDLLITMNQVQERQRMATTDGDDADVYGYHHENGMLAVNLFHMRGGKIVDRREFFWEELPEYPPELNASEHPLPESDEQENTQEQAAPSGDAESSASGSQSYGASSAASCSAPPKEPEIHQEYAAACEWSRNLLISAIEGLLLQAALPERARRS